VVVGPNPHILFLGVSLSIYVDFLYASAKSQLFRPMNFGLEGEEVFEVSNSQPFSIWSGLNVTCFILKSVDQLFTNLMDLIRLCLLQSCFLFFQEMDCVLAALGGNCLRVRNDSGISVD